MADNDPNNIDEQLKVDLADKVFKLLESNNKDAALAEFADEIVKGGFDAIFSKGETIPPVIGDEKKVLLDAHSEESPYLLFIGGVAQLHFDFPVEDPVEATKLFIRYLTNNNHLEVRGVTSTVSLPALNMLYQRLEDIGRNFHTLFTPLFSEARGEVIGNTKIGEINSFAQLDNGDIALTIQGPNGSILETVLTVNDIVSELRRALHPIDITNKRNVIKTLARFAITFQWVEQPEEA